MGKDELSQISRYVNSRSVLVISPKKVVRLFCPFPVEVIIEAGKLQAGERLQVSKVLMSQEYRLVYIIDNTPYYYGLFRIVV